MGNNGQMLRARQMKQSPLDKYLTTDPREEAMSWGDIANLTHKTQVEKFNFCTCEEQEQFPYDDCPRIENKIICGDCLYPIDKCKGCK